MDTYFGTSIQDGKRRKNQMPKSDDAILFGEAMSKHQPWSQEDAEKWAMESDVVRKATFEDDAIAGFLAGMAKAAEMINEAPTVYGNTEYKSWGEFQNHEDTHSAKLVGVRQVEEEK